jgi:SAM-dependent methyltransferase
MNLPTNATERFSDRVADYVHYRPDYPPALTAWLRDACGLAPESRVADIGAGTGISARMLLATGCNVIAVEPNAAMRSAAVAALGDNPRFAARDGRADATGLADGSVDLVTVAQAFHWFDPEAARREFARILRPGGLAAIWWNSRRLDGTAFLVGYEALLQRYGTDYARVAERYADDASMHAWFGAGLRASARFDHHQYLDFDALRGRLLSSSYAPQPGHPQHAPMLLALRALFDATAVEGHVDFAYDTRVFAGTPA